MDLREFNEVKKQLQDDLCVFSQKVMETQRENMKYFYKMLEVLNFQIYFNGNTPTEIIAPAFYVDIVPSENIPAVLYVLAHIYMKFNYKVRLFKKYNSDLELNERLNEITKGFNEAFYEFGKNGTDWKLNASNKKVLITTFKKCEKHLYHISDSTVSPDEWDYFSIDEEAKTLEEIRTQYQTISVGTKYITIKNTIESTKEKIEIGSGREMYAFMIYFSNIYIESIWWLYETHHGAHWCPLTPWKNYNQMKLLYDKLFFY